ncbi:MAG TPA: VIT family protein [Polyangiaceae bacterium]|nr:VIT family protein [Polyangiaceae bacterium]
MRHRERHRSHRIGWLRAAVLGANDGIVSTASLLLGVAASGASTHAVLASGAAGLVAGAMSMAAGEYVSVSSQADAEHADVEREKMELATNEDAEKRELAKIYVERGLTKDLARRVAEELMAHDAIGAHARDELGISEMTTARPVQAALASAGTFAVGAALPLAVAALAPPLVVAGASLACLGALGGIAANAGGASVAKGALRVLVWGALAMAATSGIGELFGAAVS